MSTHVAHAEALLGNGTVDRVLVLSIDGMHAVDFANCAKGVSPIDGGTPYCPQLAALAQRGVTYQQATTSKPSDSFPGLTAIVTGGSPRSTGAFYDVSYDRSLSPPAKTTPYGIVGGADLCPRVVGTQIGFDEEIDVDLTRIDAGGGIDPGYLPRDPKNHCAPVYPHSFIRVNTLFEVVRAAGGYTAWSDKHQSYELVKGRSGQGVDDFYAPEINSIPVSLPQVTLTACNPLPDQTAVANSNAWTDSFANIRCYDSLKVQAILSEINGRRHDGVASAPVPTVFGMNFQAVSVGEKLIESSAGLTGGYTDPYGVPTPALLDEIKFVDHSIGLIVNALRARGLLDRTLIIISAKHGQSPTDPKRVLRIPADNAGLTAPSSILSPNGVGRGYPVVQALEDDISLIWLSENNLIQTVGNVALLESHANQIGAGGGQIYAGPTLNLMFNDPAVDPRTPNIVVAPNVGVVYTGGKKKLAEHGGFAHDDTNVMLLVAHPSLAAATISTPVATAQIAPTVLAALGLDPGALDAVREEGTAVLPALQH
ncbi:MAG TPA: alkaline phosphatase family protein [Aliidongia sp.]|uniref:alkaline phosphatase family protein n=1 Tax=Aliidongia sp. TaxID=1914230 RepID=UPI002DDCF4BA|nr:alkaline phosphatase family protein [Aliidongia sp.]HEV2678370.1 alkaline phosphatase family protein [Aliidongia sp.]